MFEIPDLSTMTDCPTQMSMAAPPKAELGVLFRQALGGGVAQEDAFFDALLWRVRGLVAAIAPRRGITQPARLDDLVQEVLAKFLQKLREDRDDLLNIRDWDAVIARNVWWRLMDELRLAGKQDFFEVVRLDDLGADSSPPASVVQFLCQSAPTAWETTRCERMQLLEEFCALSQTDALTWHVVQRRLEGASFSEIAHACKLSVNACTLRYHRFGQAFRAWHVPRRDGGTTPS